MTVEDAIWRDGVSSWGSSFIDFTTRSPATEEAHRLRDDSEPSDMVLGSKEPPVGNPANFSVCCCSTFTEATGAEPTPPTWVVPERWGGEPPAGASPKCMAATSSATSNTFFFNWLTISFALPVLPFEQASLPLFAVFAMLEKHRGGWRIAFINDHHHKEEVETHFFNKSPKTNKWAPPGGASSLLDVWTEFSKSGGGKSKPDP